MFPAKLELTLNNRFPCVNVKNTCGANFGNLAIIFKAFVDLYLHSANTLMPTNMLTLLLTWEVITHVSNPIDSSWTICCSSNSATQQRTFVVWNTNAAGANFLVH